MRNATNGTVHSSTLPAPLRAINTIGNLTRKVGVKLAKLNAEQVIHAAIKKTTINNADLSGIHEPLKILINSLNSTDQLSLSGRIFTKHLLIDQVSNKIRIDAEIRNNPAILDERIEKPLFILGFPRTGTTLLHNLLAHPPTYRCPYMWETLCPSIYPDNRKAFSERRINSAIKIVKLFNYLSPELKKIHPLYPEGPDECLKLIESSFTSPHMPMYFHIPEYWDWFTSLQGNKLLDVYGYYKKQLQLLQWHGPNGTWVLKTPIHLYFIPELIDTFPDANVIQLHREPTKVAASFCSLVAASRRLYSENINMDDVGHYVIDFLRLSAERAMHAENSNNCDQFRNIDYASLVQDPKKEILGIYKQFDYEFTDAVQAGITSWLSGNPQNKHGTHKYSLEQYGLSKEIVQEHLHEYIEKHVSCK